MSVLGSRGRHSFAIRCTMPVERALYTRLSRPDLPRRPWIAYARRAVLRCRPMLTLGWPTVPADLRELADDALDQVDSYCAGGKQPRLSRTTFRSLEVRPDPLSYGSTEAHAFLHVVGELLARCRSRSALSDHPPGIFTLYYFQVPWITGRPHDEMLRLHLRTIAHDLDALEEAKQRERWAQDATVPRGFFGQLWPFGEPLWLTEPWPSDQVQRDVNA